MVLSFFVDRWPGGTEEVLHDSCERLGVLGALEVMARRQHDQRGPGDASGQDLAVRGRYDAVVSAAHDEGGGADGTEERDARPARDGQRVPEQPQSVIELPGTLVGERPNAAQDRLPSTRGGADESPWQFDDALGLLWHSLAI